MNTQFLIYFIVTAVSTFVLTAIAARILIPKLKSIKMGQKILDVGPRWHKSKEGTPTMGGLAFISASLLVFLSVGTYAILNQGIDDVTKFIFTFAYALLNGAIGSFDDIVKFTKKQNEGLSAGQKYFLQLVIAGAYLYAMVLTGALTTELYIPYFGVTLELGWFYYVFAVVMLTGIVNGVNLTDGIDGLASSVTFVIAAFYAVAAFMMGSLSGTLISALTVGSTLGFLVYNFYPARVFMGDTGSLFLGAMVVGMAFMSGNPLLVIAAGMIYIIESVSVIIQVSYYKLTHGKRFFKMAPIHHHFEKCGWSELKVVYVFSAFTLAMCIAAYFGLQ